MAYPGIYSLLANHPGDRFNPFDPDLLGALREVYTFFSQPDRCTAEFTCYRSDRYNELAAMMRMAIRKADDKMAQDRITADIARNAA